MKPKTMLQEGVIRVFSSFLAVSQDQNKDPDENVIKCCRDGVKARLNNPPQKDFEDVRPRVDGFF